MTVAEAAVERARAGFLPVLSLNASDQQHALTTPPAPSNLGTGNLTITQPIVNASAWPLYAQAKQLALAQHAQNVDDKRLLAFDAARAFFGVLAATAVVQAAQRQLDNAQANLADTQARAQAQLSSSNDVTRAQIDSASAAREVELDKGSLDGAYIALELVIDAPVSGALASPDATVRAAQQPAGQPDALLKYALDHRPDVLVSRHAANAAHDFSDEPLLRIVPTLNVQGQITGTTNPPQATGRWNDETLSATLSWTLYDAGTRYADKHSRDAQAQIADLNLQTLVRTVDAQVRTAVALLTSEQGALRVAEQAAAAARQSVDETTILYRQGLAKAIELVDANDARFTAEVAAVTAEYAVAQAYLNVLQALGTDPVGTEQK